MKASWYMVGALGLVALATPFVLLFMYANVENVRAGTLDYWFGVPDVIKAVPVVSSCDQPLYTATSGGAGEPPRSRVTYETEVSLAHAQNVLTSYFTDIACTANVADDGTILMACPDGAQASISVTDGAPCRAVSVVLTEAP